MLDIFKWKQLFHVFVLTSYVVIVWLQNFSCIFEHNEVFVGSCSLTLNGIWTSTKILLVHYQASFFYIKINKISVVKFILYSGPFFAYKM